MPSSPLPIIVDFVLIGKRGGYLTACRKLTQVYLISTRGRLVPVQTLQFVMDTMLDSEPDGEYEYEYGTETEVRIITLVFSQ